MIRRIALLIWFLLMYLISLALHYFLPQYTLFNIWLVVSIIGLATGQMVDK